MKNSLKVILLACTSLIAVDGFAAASLFKNERDAARAVLASTRSALTAAGVASADDSAIPADVTALAADRDAERARAATAAGLDPAVVGSVDTELGADGVATLPAGLGDKLNALTGRNTANRTKLGEINTALDPLFPAVAAAGGAGGGGVAPGLAVLTSPLSRTRHTVAALGELDRVITAAGAVVPASPRAKITAALAAGNGLLAADLTALDGALDTALGAGALAALRAAGAPVPPLTKVAALVTQRDDALREDGVKAGILGRAAAALTAADAAGTFTPADDAAIPGQINALTANRDAERAATTAARAAEAAALADAATARDELVAAQTDTAAARQTAHDREVALREAQTSLVERNTTIGDVVTRLGRAGIAQVAGARRASVPNLGAMVDALTGQVASAQTALDRIAGLGADPIDARTAAAVAVLEGVSTTLDGAIAASHLTPADGTPGAKATAVVDHLATLELMLNAIFHGTAKAGIAADDKIALLSKLVNDLSSSKEKGRIAAGWLATNMAAAGGGAAAGAGGGTS